MAQGVAHGDETLFAHVRAFLDEYVLAGETVCIALSGGLDSMVLLDVLTHLRAPLRLRMSAVHVDHGLSPNAPSWAAFCVRQCERRGVPLRVERVEVGATRGLGLEAAARKARYAALARQSADHIVLAHHRNDQAETLLLRLLRGAGVRGLSAMRPAQRLTLRLGAETANRISVLRPLLDIDRGVLQDYARRQQLEWCDDESNLNLDLDRNFLRHEILPRLAARFPHYATTFARAARHLTEAQRLLEECAQQDVHACINDARLQLVALRALPSLRAAQVVRAYAEQHAHVVLSAAQTKELLRQLQESAADAQVEFRLGERVLRAERGEAFLLHEESAGADGKTLSLAWQGEQALRLPEPYGTLRFVPARGAGLSLRKLRAEAVTVRSRRGGERLRPAAQRPTRTLKNLLQEARMPSWQRQRLPLLFCGDQLVCVPGVAAAAEFQAQAGEEGIVVVWQAHGR